MKKQIFILVLIVLALFMNQNNTYAQAVAGTAARGTSCTGDALHPIAGQPYTYQAASDQSGNYTFWATKDVNFISTTGGVTTTNMASTMLKSSSTTPTGTDLLNTSGNYASPASTDNVIITWSDAVLAGTTLASPTFVAVNQDGSCTNNFKVWSIIPTKAFTVDITNVNHTTKTSLAYETAESQCFDAVRGAHYDIPTNTMQYDFGTQILYFEVIAANFTASWTPTFTLTGLGNGQTAVIQWAYTTAFTTPVTVTSGTASPSRVLTSVTNTSTGVSIYVMVTITNHTYEGIASTPIHLAVDGQNSAGDWDIVNNTVAAPTPVTCIAATGADQNDVAIQTLNPRPTVTPVAPTPFVAGNQTN